MKLVKWTLACGAAFAVASCSGATAQGVDTAAPALSEVRLLPAPEVDPADLQVLFWDEATRTQRFREMEKWFAGHEVPAATTTNELAKGEALPEALVDEINATMAKTNAAGVMVWHKGQVRYEGYGPGGVAVLIEALTDNRNRTAADLRSAFSKNGGNLGETGCVGWMFEPKGVVTIAGPIDEEALLEAALDGGAESYELTMIDEDQAGAEVYCDPTDLETLSEVLRTQRYSINQIENRWIPSNTVDGVDPDHARSLLKMMDAIADLDDVQSVTANFEMAANLMAAGIL